MKYFTQDNFPGLLRSALISKLVLCALLFFVHQFALGQCFYQGPVEIEDLSSEFITLEVEGALNDSLGVNGQGICGVNINFTHTAVGDLVVQLISPEGQVVTLIGPTTSPPPFTDFAEWNIGFVPCNVTAIPDPGFMDQWQNNQDWSAFGNYSGSYYPYQGCFEDLDEGSVNGTWTLLVQDGLPDDDGVLIGFSIVFCDPTGIDCQACEPDGGFITGLPIELCQGDTILNLPEPDYINGEPDESDYFYHYLLVKEDSIVGLWTDSLNVAEDAGQFRIYGISLLKQDSSVLDSAIQNYTISELIDALNQNIPVFCASISLGFVNLTVNPTYDELIEVVQCAGEGFLFGDTLLTEPGSHFFQYQTVHGCDSIVEVNLQFDSVETSITASDSILNCHIPEIQLNGAGSVYPGDAFFNWWTSDGNITGPEDSTSATVDAAGTYFLEIGVGLCRDTASVEVTGNPDGPLVEFEVNEMNCLVDSAEIWIEDTTGLLSASWTGPDGFEETGFSLQVAAEGLYFAEVIDVDSCAAIDSIWVMGDFSQPSFAIDSIGAPCEGDSINLTDDTFDPEWEISWYFEGDTLEGNQPLVWVPGVYVADIVGVNGCIGTDSIVFHHLHPKPEVTFASAPLDCRESSVLLIATTGISNSSYQWMGPGGFQSGSQQIQAPEPGRYDLSVITPQGCELDTFYNLVSLGNLPEITFALSDSSGCISDSVQIITDSDFSQLDYNWNGPGGFESTESSPWVSEEGWYFLEVISPGSCEVLDSVFVPNEIPLSDFVISSDTLNCEREMGYLRVDGPPGWEFNWSGPGLLDSSGDSVRFEEAGEYSLTISDANEECTGTISHETVGDFSLPLAWFSADSLSCVPETAFISLDSTDGFLLDLTGPGIVEVESNQVEVDRAGTYQFFIGGNNGCVDTFDVVVFGDTLPPAIDFSAPVIGCGQDSVLLEYNATGTIAFQEWYGPDGFFSTDSSVFTSVPGDYTLIYEGINGCADTVQFEVVEDMTAPPITIASVQEINCANDQVVVSIQDPLPGFDYSWTLPNGDTVEGDSLTTSQSGWHFVDVADLDGCMGRDSVFVNENFELPDFSIWLDSISCQRDSATVEVMTDTGSSFSWTGPGGFESDSGIIRVGNAGVYNLQVVGSNGCSVDTSIAVVADTFPPEISILGDSVLTCTDSVIELTASISGHHESLTWTLPGGEEHTGVTLNATQAGLYSLEVLGENGCIAFAEITVEIDTTPIEFEAITTEISCQEPTASIQLVIDGDFEEVLWPTEIQEGASPELGSSMEGGTFLVGVRGVNGCLSEKEIEIAVDTLPPIVDIELLSQDCIDMQSILVAVADTTVAELQWFDESGFLTSDDSVVVEGSALLTLRAIGENGCIAELDYVLEPEYDLPSIEFEPVEPISCDRNEVVINAGESDSGPGFIFSWTGPGIVSGADSSVIVVDAVGEYTLELLDEESGCAASETIVVEGDTTPPLANAVALGEISCENEEVSLVAEGSSEGDNILYEWLPMDEEGNVVSGQNSFEAVVDRAGSYVLIVTSADNGCSAADTIFVEESGDLIRGIEYKITEPTCFGEVDGVLEVVSVDGGTAPYTFSFDGGDSFDELEVIGGLAAGDYPVIVRDANGCEYSQNVLISEPDELLVSLGGDRSVELGQTVILTGELSPVNAAIEEWLWDPLPDFGCVDCPEAEFAPEDDIQVQVTVVDSNGCNASDQINISVTVTRSAYLPNAFSPNEDGVNDFFGVYGEPDRLTEILEFRVFDRWGNQVFVRQNVEYIPELDEATAWDGTFRGEEVPPGIYTYFVVLRFMDGQKERMQGDVLLVR